MKTIKIIIASLSVLTGFSQSAVAQTKPLHLDVNYNYSMPISAFKSDLVSNNSPRGFMAGINYSFTDNLSAGIEFGFQDYYQQYPRALYPLGKTQEVSAVLTNSIQTTPVLLSAKYFPLPASFIKPYVSLGAGGNIIDFNQYLGEFGNGQTSIGFRAQGGLGILIPFGKFHSSGFNIGANYDYAPYNKNGYKDLNSVNLQAGIRIGLK